MYRIGFFGLSPQSGCTTNAINAARFITESGYPASVVEPASSPSASLTSYIPKPEPQGKKKKGQPDPAEYIGPAERDGVYLCPLWEEGLYELPATEFQLWDYGTDLTHIYDGDLDLIMLSARPDGYARMQALTRADGWDAIKRKAYLFLAKCPQDTFDEYKELVLRTYRLTYSSLSCPMQLSGRIADEMTRKGYVLQTAEQLIGEWEAVPDRKPPKPAAKDTKRLEPKDSVKVDEYGFPIPEDFDEDEVSGNGARENDPDKEAAPGAAEKDGGRDNGKEQGKDKPLKEKKGGGLFSSLFGRKDRDGRVTLADTKKARDKEAEAARKAEEAEKKRLEKEQEELRKEQEREKARQLAAEKEAARKAAEEEVARELAEKQKHAAEERAQRAEQKKAEEERRKAEAEAKKAADAERKRRLAEEAAARKAEEDEKKRIAAEEAAARKAEEEERRKAEAEEKKRADEEAKRIAAEQRKAEEERRRTEEERRKAEAEQKRREEEERRKAEEEARRAEAEARKAEAERAKAEAARLKAEAAEAERLRKEEEKSRREAEKAAKKAAREEETARKKAELEERQRKAEEERQAELERRAALLEEKKQEEELRRIEEEARRAAEEAERAAEEERRRTEEALRKAEEDAERAAREAEEAEKAEAQRILDEETRANIARTDEEMKRLREEKAAREKAMRERQRLEAQEKKKTDELRRQLAQEEEALERARLEKLRIDAELEKNKKDAELLMEQRKEIANKRLELLGITDEARQENEEILRSNPELVPVQRAGQKKGLFRSLLNKVTGVPDTFAESTSLTVVQKPVDSGTAKKASFIGHLSVFVTSLEHSASATHTASGIAAAFARTGIKSCLCHPAGTPLPTSPLVTEDTSGTDDAYISSRAVIYDRGTMLELTPDQKKELKRSDVKVMCCKGEDAGISALARFIHKEGEKAREWIYVFNTLSKKRRKLVAGMLLDYDTLFLDAFDVDDIEPATVKQIIEAVTAKSSEIRKR